MQEYACGFLFSLDRTRVLLIRKRRPAWQAGKLNGLGGKVEPGESPLQAMQREFREEAGVEVVDWQEVLWLKGSDWEAHFFRAFGELESAEAMTDEALEIHPTSPLPADTIPNLQWMIPMLLDDEVVTRLYGVRVSSSEG